MFHVVALVALAAAAPVTRTVTFSTPSSVCHYDGKSAYVCGDPMGAAAQVTETQSVVDSATVTVVIPDGDRCLTPGVAVRIDARQKIKVDATRLKLLVDSRVVVPTLAVELKRIAPQLFELDPGTSLALTVIDEGSGAQCWSARDVKLALPMGPDARQEFTWTGRIEAHPDALAIAARATPEPKVPTPLEPEPVRPEGYNGVIPPRDSTLQTVAIVVGAVAGGAVGVGMGSLIAVSKDESPLDPNSLVPTALFTGLLAMGGGAAGMAAIEPTPDPREAPFLEHQRAKASWDERKKRFDAEKAQHDAWTALQARSR
jgi:hypothetical protein